MGLYILLIFMIPIALLVWFICDIVNDRRYDRQYQKYLDSISVGDIFEPNFIDEGLDDDPFKEKLDYSEYRNIIIDIKKNYKGETWVKYKRLKDDGIERTSEIQAFDKVYTRVKKSEI